MILAGAASEAATGAGWTSSNTIAIVALGVTIGSLGLTLWFQNKGRREDRAEARRRESAMVLGHVRGFLTDIDPDRLGINARRGETPERLAELRRRWEHEIRPPVEAIAAAFPSPTERDLAGRLSVELNNALHMGGQYAMDLIQPAGAIYSTHPPDLRGIAKDHHTEARRLADELAAAIRGDARRRWGRRRRKAADRIPAPTG